MLYKDSINRIIILISILLLPVSSSFSQGLSMSGVWPYISPHETTINSNYLFQGKSNRVYAYDKTTLAFVSSSSPLPVNEEIMSLFSYGTTLFAACGFGGIYIFDISNPIAGITQTGHYKNTEFTDFYTDVCVDGNLLYASIIVSATLDNTDTPGTDEYIPASPGIVIVNITNSSSPVFTSRVSIPDPKQNMTILGIGESTIPAITIKGVNGKTFAFSSWARVLLIYDITDSTTPSFKSYKPVLAPIADIVTDDQYIYLTNNGTGFMIEDINKLEQEIATYGDGFTVLSGESEEIYTCIYNQYGAYAESISIKNDYAYIADLRNGLQIVDISNPLNFHRDNYGTQESPNLSYGEPFLKGSFNTNIANAHSVTLDNTIAYLSDQKSGLSRIDVSDIASLSATVAPFTPVVINIVSILDGYIFATGMINDKHSFAVIDLLTFRLITVLELPINLNQVSEIYIQRNGENQSDKVYAYLACGSDGVKIIEVTNDAAVSQGVVQSISGSNSRNIQISNDFAFIANGSGGISVFDVTNPLSPVAKPVITLSDARDLKIKEVETNNTTASYLFVANGADGLVIFDITDPSSPQQTAISTLPQFAEYLTLSDNCLYVADADDTPGTIHFFDISNSGSITNENIGDKRQGTWKATNNEILSIAASDTHLYIASGENGVVVVDVKDKAAPVELTDFQTSVYSNSITLNSNNMYLMTAAKKAGLIMYNVDFSEPFEPGPDFNKLFTYDKTPLKISNEGCFIGSLD